MTPELNKIYQGDALEVLKTFPDECIDSVITSPPYWKLRDYEVKGQIGLEESVQGYLIRLAEVFLQVKRVLKSTGTCFVVISDTYYGGGRNKGNHNPKIKSKSVRGLVNLGDTVPGPRGPDRSLALVPERFAIDMMDNGWLVRNVIIWHKPNCMPSSAKNRFTVDFEYVFFFTKSKKYFFKTQFEPFQSNDYDRARMARARTEYGGKWAKESGGAIKTQRAFVAGNKEGRTKRCVWSVGTRASGTEHYATYPADLIIPMIKAGSPEEGIVLDPFMGTGTTAIVAKQLNRKYLGIELNSKDIRTANQRLRQDLLL